MHQVDSKGVAADIIGPLLGSSTDTAATARVVARVAAWSMLQDNPAHAPYGWTHCLTLAQAECAGSLDLVHRDPFDRILAAQAVDLGVALATSDIIIANLGCQII